MVDTQFGQHHELSISHLPIDKSYAANERISKINLLQMIAPFDIHK